MGRIKFQSLVSCGVAGLPRNHFSAELNERREFKWKRKFFVFIVLLVFFSSYQCLIRACAESTRNKCLSEYFEASECSKDLLDSLSIDLAPEDLKGKIRNVSHVQICLFHLGHSFENGYNFVDLLSKCDFLAIKHDSTKNSFICYFIFLATSWQDLVWTQLVQKFPCSHTLT